MINKKTEKKEAVKSTSKPDTDAKKKTEEFKTPASKKPEETKTNKGSGCC